MSVFLIILMIINLGISFWNAKVTGEVWHDSKAVGGWVRVSAWAGAVMSAVGFTSIYAIVLTVSGYILGYLPKEAVALANSLIYVLVALPVLGAGFIIMINSWIAVSRERSLINCGSAAWNTLAMAYNTYSVVTSFGGAWTNVKDGFAKAISSDGDIDLDSDFAKAAMFVLLALFGGVISTVVVMRRYMGAIELPAKARAVH